MLGRGKIMYDIFEILIGIIVGSCYIVYGITRTETNFDMLKYALTTNAKIENKKGFATAYKINYLISGILILILILSFLLYFHVLSVNGMSLCFLIIIALKSIIRIFIQIKYSKKSSKVKHL